MRKILSLLMALVLSVAFANALSHEDKYFMKNCWNGGDWSWKEMTAVGDGTFKLENVVFGGTGVNYNTKAEDGGAQWVALDAISGDKIKAMDEVTFVLNPANGTVTATLVSQASGDKFYMKNCWNGGDWSWKEMTAIDGGKFKLEKVVYGGVGVNINFAPSDADATWIANDAILGDKIDVKDTVTFVADPNAKTVTATLVGTFVPSGEQGGDDPQPASKYYMKNNWNGGEDWTWKEMAAAENNTFKLEKVVFGGTGVNYNTAENDEGAQWVEVAAFDGDAVAALDTVTFVLDPAAEKKVKATLLGKYESSGDPQPASAYLLIGSDPAIGGDAWDGSKAVALVDGKATVTLQAGDCQFKVVPSDWNWDNALGFAQVDAECSSKGVVEGTDNNNIKVTLAESGDMTVEIKDGKLCVTGNFVTGEQPVETHTYKIYGNIEALGNWAGDKAVEMPNGEVEIQLDKDVECLFKVIVDDWAAQLGYDDVNLECSSKGVVISDEEWRNVKVVMAEAGKMKVQVVGGKLCVTGNFVAGDEPGGDPQIEGYFLIGSDPAIGGQDWVGANAVSMTDGKATVTLQAGECQFKVVPVINGAWDWDKALGYADVDAECSSAGIESGDNGNVKVVLDVAGEVKVEVKNGKLCVTGEFTIPTTLNLANGFYLIGKTGWTVDALSADLLFKANADKAGEYTLEIALVENDPLKVVKVEGDAITAWYPEGEGNEYKVDAAHAGLKTIYFQETMNPDWAAFGGYIYIEGTTGIESVENAASAQKFIEDGQLFILINGTVYSVMGMVR